MPGMTLPVSQTMNDTCFRWLNKPQKLPGCTYLTKMSHIITAEEVQL